MNLELFTIQKHAQYRRKDQPLSLRILTQWAIIDQFRNNNAHKSRYIEHRIPDNNTYIIYKRQRKH